MPGNKPTAIDTYLSSLTSEKRDALQRLRKAIQAAAPRAEECISYGMPAFRLDGRVLVYFSASAKHCSFFPGSGTTVSEHASLLKGYDTSKGTIRFSPDRPLPAALVRKIVKARIAENATNEKKGRLPVTKQTPSKKPKGRVGKSKENRSDPAVDALLAKLDHPLAPVVQAIRRLILGVDPRIGEGVKWNAPSYRLADWFATAGVRPKDAFVRVVLHTGAKVKEFATTGLRIDDPDGLLEWHAKDRASVCIDSMNNFDAKSAAMRRIVRQWISHL